VSASAGLTSALQKLVLRLEADLRTRADADPEVLGRWRREHEEASQRGRTASAWLDWRNDRVTQAAVAWVLTTVFIRFCEDNGLLGPVWISGPGQRRQEALDARDAFFREHPEDTDREWLEQAIAHLGGLRATAALVDEHSALDLVSPSGQAATEVLEFWWQRGEDGASVHDLSDQTLSTRFLGDLYQDLSEYAKAKYALLQTPVFVEEFILDRTLEPALADRPLEGFRMIDPTCGSGHFLLGAFDRLLDRWHRHAPGMEVQARVQTALDAIHGVDLNPFAVAIARFRLTVAALQACGLRSLENAPAFGFHLAAGDSLLHGGQLTLDLGTVQTPSDATLSGFTYSTEDLTALRQILTPGEYDAVVGNPPYITVKDKALNAAYRERYSMCHRGYAMTVPFIERFFELARLGNGDQPPGWVGQITSNSFMKREFGTKLIEQFLAKRDLRLVVDTSGACIPGHGTPTVIIVGRNHSPMLPTVRTVLRVRREPGHPDDAAKGIVWRSIVEHVDDRGWDDGWINVIDLDRSRFAKHPWLLGGGGAVQLLDRIEDAMDAPLLHRIAEIGFGAVTREDSAYMLGAAALRRHRVDAGHQMALVGGEALRDWAMVAPTVSIWPYGSVSFTAEEDPGIRRILWPLRATLNSRVAYGSSQLERGLAWFEYSMFFAGRFRTPLSIGYAFKTSHNHFVLDRGGKVFNRTAPIIKLWEGSSEDDHFALLGTLNSSTVLFWLHENAQHQGGGAAAHPWSWTYEFSGTIVGRVPLPGTLPVEGARTLDCLAQQLTAAAPNKVCSSSVPTREALDAARDSHQCIRAKMVAQQEELDWEVYRLYGIIDEDLTYGDDDLPGLTSPERAFAIVLARQVVEGEAEATWFTHETHRFTPITAIPAHWPDGYRDLVARRIELIESHPYLRLLERPECKRRWESEPWEKQEEGALRSWLLDRLEDRRFWLDSQGRPAPRSIAQLADEVARVLDIVGVLALWEGRPDVPLTRSLIRLLKDEAVPYLAAHRYKDSGLAKREAWEESWVVQRREDAGQRVETIPMPPEYTSADYRKTSYWHHRGKLDVPKERFILYPDGGRDTDPTPLLGWAGWDHAQQALALSQVLGAREDEGWPDERLVPLVAGLVELQPWVEQWHSELDPKYGVSLAAFCREQLTSRAAQVGMSLGELRNWRPQPAARRARAAR
jgi:hypothetical protein